MKKNSYKNDNNELKEFLDTGALDVAKALPSLTKKEYEYYMALPDNEPIKKCP